MKTKLLTITAIYACLAAGEVETPIDVEISTETITLTWGSDDVTLPYAASAALENAELNFDNPKPGTNDLHIAVSRGGRATPRIRATINRLNFEAYREIIDSDIFAVKEQPLDLDAANVIS